jgi:hypothetical protein
MIAIPPTAWEIGSTLPLRTGLHVVHFRITDIAQVDGVLLYLVRSGALEFWLNERALQSRRRASWERRCGNDFKLPVGERSASKKELNRESSTTSN